MPEMGVGVWSWLRSDALIHPRSDGKLKGPDHVDNQAYVLPDRYVDVDPAQH